VKPSLSNCGPSYFRWTRPTQGGCLPKRGSPVRDRCAATPIASDAIDGERKTVTALFADIKVWRRRKAHARAASEVMPAAFLTA